MQFTTCASVLAVAAAYQTPAICNANSYSCQEVHPECNAGDKNNLFAINARKEAKDGEQQWVCGTTNFLTGVPNTSINFNVETIFSAKKDADTHKWCKKGTGATTKHGYLVAYPLNEDGTIHICNSHGKTHTKKPVDTRKPNMNAKDSDKDSKKDSSDSDSDSEDTTTPVPTTTQGHEDKKTIKGKKPASSAAVVGVAAIAAAALF